MERYKKLFNLENDLYHEGSGVIIEAGALLLDTKTDLMVAQLKFKNITSKRIKGIQISLNCFDIGGKELQGVDEFQYLDLDIPPNQEFGSKTPINLPSANTRSYSIKECTIYYEDTTQCKLGSVWESLKKAKVKSGSVEFKKQYKLEFGENAQYEYNKCQDLWYCVCGSINREENATCICCRVKREKLELLDDEQIESKMLARVAREDEIAKAAREKEERERVEKERIEREQREIKARKRAKTRKILLRVILSASAIAVVVIAIIHFVWGIPNGRYKDACALLEAKKYDEAYEAFVALEGFKDSETMESECIYQKAIQYLNEKEYDLAVEEFNKILDYEDSATMLLEVDYQKAMDNFNRKIYSVAKVGFQKLGNYKDSEEMVLECNYQTALDYLDRCMFDSALNEFRSLATFYYKDSEEMIIECKYQYVLYEIELSRNWAKQDYYVNAYLDELVELDYKDAIEIYDDLYTWKVTLTCFNTDKDNYTVSPYYIARSADFLHFGFEVTGGEYGETINLTHSYQWSGEEEKWSDWHWESEGEGGYIGAEWSNGYSCSEPSSLTIRIYNLDTGKLMATERVWTM